MSDGLTDGEYRKPMANKYSWPEFGRAINNHFMEQMNINPRAKHPYELYFLALAMCGEAGELANKVKKAWRDGMTDQLRKEIASEVADVDIYLQHIADWLGINRDQNAANKVNECLDRWPQIDVDDVIQA